MTDDKDSYSISDSKGAITQALSAQGQDASAVEERQFTLRALVVGTILGGFVSASNLYIGLKVGWVFGASMFGALFGFAILKPFSRMTGSYFGPKENCVVQTAATTTGGLYVGFFTAIPALYHLKLMSANFMDDIPALILWTAAAAFFGQFFAVPLRRYFVIKQKLPFPSPTATAEAIRQLHASMTGELEAMRKAKLMFGCFIVSAVVPIIGVFIPLLESVHLLYWIGVATGSQGLIGADRVWKWVINLDPAFLGAGTLIPSSTVLSLFLGQLISYGIAGPLMLTSGSIISASGFSPNGPSAQSWFLWPGIVLMLVSSFTELLCNGGSIVRAVRGGFTGLRNVTRRTIRRWRRSSAVHNISHDDDDRDDDDDPAPRNERIPAWMWIVGLVIAAMLNCLVLGFYFHMPAHQSILAIVIAFVLSFVGLQSVGETDINPAGSIGKTSQLVFSQFSAPTLADAQRLSLMAGNVAGSASYQAVDMVKDLLTGHLLGGSPLAQFYTQFVGSFFAIFIGVGIFILYASAYPCVTDASKMPCEFQLVGVVAWKNVAVTMTTGLDIPYESKMFSVACGIFAAVYTLFKKFVVPERYHGYMLNINALGIGFVNADPGSAFGMLCGNLIFMLWSFIQPKRAEFYHYSVGGGLLSGAGIAGLIKALLNIFGANKSFISWGTPSS
ncbi:OPT superfamily oligopeptide transporter [Basidiobolus meristosporus CBS 931.73]|uniref:OPT superfamily oligopeptide transporter n=1 Tax=Basidiobolus meristosporus CBS 931.73 TaxID=1314790 RepID=A0A1Y1Z6Z5_9FUNG|nr:OPT superfamily oligopeptide transporter [Basidiobolus meristosporus CBS 931.73]|eukprot:ORY05976.1 OPT superfamily oligopeptide transporter [Basidiobolus meristosporus CBS 931.73]